MKYYEEQELSMQVAANDLLGLVAPPSSGEATPPSHAPLTTDNNSVGYATVLESRAKLRQRQPDNDNHEYHELVDGPEGPTARPAAQQAQLGCNAKGVPELVTQLM